MDSYKPIGSDPGSSFRVEASLSFSKRVPIIADELKHASGLAIAAGCALKYHGST